VAEDVVHGWTLVYPHLRYEDPTAAIAWLGRVFGLLERVRMADSDGTIITSKLETPGGGLIMVVGGGSDFLEWLRERVPSVRESKESSWPHLTHTITVLVEDVDAHHARARAEGATILMVPTDQPWGLRTCAALDLEGHQWEFAQVMRMVEPEAWGAARID
jgi:uncharacterized glyoxalase superfamily protein PhnB